ncbi:NADP-dependent oxidoreductase domain-containing protein [Thelonectria olida]|uniref:NADP-dependent oxidoreductase domain-containing protein n=1 Tax=Thelonectria olida TaxID=1576542 RepID=A0A9P8WFV3_9HYPO|nr:NADP-dependent oxidoreductase domain-containing protein [Thelonectria olida]
MSTSASPRVILGLMTYGPGSFPDARVTSVEELQKHLDTFRQLGYSEIDTARIYINGEQEKFTAQAGWKEKGLQVATKSYPLAPLAHTATNLRKDLEASLSGLDTEQVDIFYLHAADRSVPFTETLGAANAMFLEGKFKRLGLSNYSAYEVAEIVMLCDARGWIKPTIYQGVYNVIARNLETEVIPACHRFGLGVVIYNPLAGGLLSGKFKASAQGADVAEGRYDAKTFLGPIYRSLYFNKASFEALEVIQEAASKHDLSLIEVALRWCVHHSALKTSNQGGSDGVLIGVSKVEQIEQNVADLRKGPLPEDVVQALDKAWLMAKASSLNPWHTPLVYTYKGYSKP